MSNDYEVMSKSVTDKEYKLYLSQADYTEFRKCDDTELRQVEQLLGVKTDLLAGQEFWVSKKKCDNCSHELSFIDFVTTALSKSDHSKAFLTHALVGNSYGFQTPRDVECSNCGETIPQSSYRTPNYSCREGGGGLI